METNKTPLSDRWEHLTAVHEAAHAVTAHALGVRIYSIELTTNTDMDRIRGRMRYEHTDPMNEAIMSLAGGMGSALAEGRECPFMFRNAVLPEVIAYRLKIKCNDSAPVEFLPELTAEAHVSPGDVSDACMCVELLAKGITDEYERNCAMDGYFMRAQIDALFYTSTRKKEILALADLPCQRGGKLTKPEIEIFFKAVQQ